VAEQEQQSSDSELRAPWSQQAESPRRAFIKYVTENPLHVIQRPDIASVERLRQIADWWSACGDHFAAGYVLSQCASYAWGDVDATVSCSVEALKEFQVAISSPGVDPLEQVASLWMCLVELGMTGIWLGLVEIDSLYRSLQSGLGHALAQLGAKAEDVSAHEGFLIRGLLLTTDLDGNWSTVFPEVEIQGHSMSIPGDGRLTFSVESAFRYLIDSGDYTAADTIANQCPQAFTTPGLRGWRAAVIGLLNGDVAVERFAEAAAEFALDTPSEARREAGLSWNSRNQSLWAKYFTARSLVADIVPWPSRASELLDQAQEALKGTEAGWVSPQVTCFRIILRVIARLLANDADAEASRAKEALLQSRRVLGTDESDELVIDFLDLVTSAFSELRREPAAVVLSTGVRDALTALGRIPLVGSAVASAISPLVARHTFASLYNQSYAWMYRTIESITDERTFQQLILRLMRGRLPIYAQIRHGPLEYGKDIVVLVDDNGVIVLRMYQVKVGDISVPIWRVTRGELEEIFQVELPDVQLPVDPERREGVLIFNGHLNANVEAPVKGWLAEQRRDHSRTFTIMHLDLVVDWIVSKGLINELHRGLAELGIPILE
jgi:hypothetical protein